MHPLLSSATAHLEDTVNFLRALVEAESPSDDKAAVDRCGGIAGRHFADMGAEITLHPRDRAGDIVEARFASASTAARPVLLLGHLDTVWGVGTLTRMPWRDDGERLWGPGVFDMKSGVALAWTALRLLRESGGLPGPVTVLLTTDEETGSLHSRELIEARARESVAVLVPEPAHGPAGALKTARKGVGDYTLEVTGVPAHAGLDFEKGHSAVLELARQIERVSGFTDLPRGLTVSVGTVSGGTRRNVVPASAVAGVDVRIARLVDGPEIDARIRRLAPVDPACSLRVSGGINRPPMERTPATAALFARAQGIARELRFEVDEVAVGGGSDGNFTSGAGAPTLDGLGAVGDGAHAAHEQVVKAELPRRAALLAGLMKVLLSTADER